MKQFSDFCRHHGPGPALWPEAVAATLAAVPAEAQLGIAMGDPQERDGLFHGKSDETTPLTNPLMFD